MVVAGIAQQPVVEVAAISQSSPLPPDTGRCRTPGHGIVAVVAQRASLPPPSTRDRCQRCRKSCRCRLRHRAGRYRRRHRTSSPLPARSRSLPLPSAPRRRRGCRCRRRHRQCRSNMYLTSLQHIVEMLTWRFHGDGCAPCSPAWCATPHEGSHWSLGCVFSRELGDEDLGDHGIQKQWPPMTTSAFGCVPPAK